MKKMIGLVALCVAGGMLFYDESVYRADSDYFIIPDRL